MAHVPVRADVMVVLFFNNIKLISRGNSPTFLNFRKLNFISNVIDFKIIIGLGLLISCTEKTNNLSEDTYSLHVIESISVPIDEGTRTQTDAIFPFKQDDNSYFAFLNANENSILIYSLDSLKLVHKVVLQAEGDQGVGYAKGFMMSSMDSIYITPKMNRTIFVVNQVRDIIEKIPYKRTKSNEEIEMAFYSRSDINTPLIRIGSKIYLTNYLFGNYTARSASDLANHPVCIELDVKSNEANFLPMKFMNDYWKNSNYYEPSYARIFNGDHFVYLWRYYDKLRVTKDHNTVAEYPLQSRYFKSFGKMPPPADVDSNLRDLLASPGYFNIVWDAYRQVYYVLAFHGIEVESGMNLMDAWRDLSPFSIIVLDKNFSILGETLMPANYYYIENFFVSDKGLYLSKANPKNPAYSDESLAFDIFSLVKN